MSGHTEAGAPILPPRILAALLASIASVGVLANCLLLLALLTRNRSGLFCLLTQLAVADLLVLGTSIWPELWSYNAGTWEFGGPCCVAYRGLSLFASTASMYLIITVALHTLATINQENNETYRRTKQAGDGEDDEIRSSRHSLVANSDSSTPPRTMNVDYRIRDKRVSVSPPTVFLWILSASLSVPEFALTTTVDIGNNVVLCTLIDSTHRENMNWMLSIFNFLLPMIIILSVIVLIVIKLCGKKRVSSNCEEFRVSLKLSLWLIISFCILCAPRSIVFIYSTLISSDIKILENGLTEYRNNILTEVNLVLGSGCLLAASVRPLLCITLLPRLRKVFAFRCCENAD